MIHVYLSPHLDDAVLSCGGAIHRRTAAGEAVLVITVFAGEAGSDAELSAFALEQHGYWGNPPRPMALRRAEDQAAMALLGARTQHLEHLDAVYRTAADGQWLYPDLEALFGAVHPADPMARDGAQRLSWQLADLVPSLSREHVVIAPLALGGHVDHQITHTTALRLLELGYHVAFYEDYPYAERLGMPDATPNGAPIESWRPEIVRLGAADAAAKVAALRYYQTQLHVLFGRPEEMPSRAEAFALTRAPEAGLAERIWWPQ